MDGIVGVWALRSFVMETVETGERAQPFGETPRGTLILHPDGRMVALITPGEQAGAESDPAPAMPKLVAYSGRYRLEPPDRLVTAVDVAWLPAWVGTDQVRTYRLDGDRLEFATPPVRMPQAGGPDATVTGRLLWVREA